MVTCHKLTYGDVEVVLLSTGASIRSVRLPGRDGTIDDITLGHPTEADYKVRPRVRKHWFS